MPELAYTFDSAIMTEETCDNEHSQRLTNGKIAFFKY